MPSNAGRKKLLSLRDRTKVIRTFHLARAESPNVTSKKIQVEAGLVGECSNRTLQRVLNDNKFYYLQARKKGLLTSSDLKKRLAFAKDLVKGKVNTAVLSIK